MGCAGMKIRSQVARYEEIRQALEAKILSGEWPPGQMIPSEYQLVAEYGYSRMTVHRALSELVAAGLLIRRQGKGTFVANPPSHTTVLEITDVRADILSKGGAPRHVLLSRAVQAGSSIRTDQLQAAPNAKVLSLSLLHLADGLPFAVEQRLINLDAVPDAEDQDFEMIPPGSWLLEQVPWSDAEHRIRAAACDGETARLLTISPSEPCLIVERRTYYDQRPITWVRLTYPGDRHDLVGTFTYAKRKRVPGSPGDQRRR